MHESLQNFIDTLFQILKSMVLSWDLVQLYTNSILNLVILYNNQIISAKQFHIFNQINLSNDEK